MDEKRSWLRARGLLAATLAVGFAHTAQAELFDRGGGMVYDSALNVTWLQNWNQAVGSSFDTLEPGTGRMTWDTATAWAESLTWGGFTDWRLPTMLDTAAPGCDFSNAGGTDCGYNVQTLEGNVVFSEMAHLWYASLGNLAQCAPGVDLCNSQQPGWGLSNTGPFTNIQTDADYWTGVGYAPLAQFAWFFGTFDGFQDANFKGESFYAVAVHPGDVAAVPEPGTWAMMALGTVLLGTAMRRRTR